MSSSSNNSTLITKMNILKAEKQLRLNKKYQQYLLLKAKK